MRFLWILFFIPTTTQAAPIPGTTSSQLVSEKPGLFRSPLGFEIHAADTKWQLAAPPKNNPYILTVFRSQSMKMGVQGALTVRLDIPKKHKSIASYVKMWMKDYPRLGFEILSAKKIKLNERIGYLLDLISRDNHIQLRQVLFKEGKHVVNLTCRDHQNHFSETLHNCNEIIRTFKW